jgi:hypothetical protein
MQKFRQKFSAMQNFEKRKLGRMQNFVQKPKCRMQKSFEKRGPDENPQISSGARSKKLFSVY